MVPPLTSDPAPIRVREPTTARSSTVAWLPISASAPMVHECTTHACPTVAPGPISVVWSAPECSTEPSCTLAPSRTAMVPKSARRTAPNQTEAPASTTTSPIRSADGATKAVGWMTGVFPSKE